MSDCSWPAVGVAAGLAATRLIRSQLFVVPMVDWPSLATGLVLLLVSALVAAYLPGRRAARHWRGSGRSSVPH